VLQIGLDVIVAYEQCAENGWTSYYHLKVKCCFLSVKTTSTLARAAICYECIADLNSKIGLYSSTGVSGRRAATGVLVIWCKHLHGPQSATILSVNDRFSGGEITILKSELQIGLDVIETKGKTSKSE
jgi:hypothetical protein